MGLLRIIIFVFAVNFLFFLFTELISANNYADVPPSHKHSTAITELSVQKIINGYPNGEFHPEGLINRAEAVKILIETKSSPEIINNALNGHKNLKHSYVIFPDVKINDWFGKYIEIAFKNNIIKGYPNGKFLPAGNINFAEALKIILQTFNADTTNTPYTNNSLLYIKKGDWFEPYFTYAYETNLINQNKFYHPAQLITRGEFAEIVYRIQTVQKNNLPEFIQNHTQTSSEYTITIPKLNIINLPVYSADISDKKKSLEILKKGLGYYLATPDQQKKSVIFGHSSGYHWDNSPYKTVLKKINELYNGDKIYINYKEKGYIYNIYKSDIIPANEDHKIIDNQNENELAIYTCWPPNSIKKRYIVYGKPEL